MRIADARRKRASTPTWSSRWTLWPSSRFWRLSSSCGGRKSGSRGQDSTRHLTKAHAVPIALTPAGQGETIAVLKEPALLAVGKTDRLGAFPRQFPAAAVRVTCRPADRAGSQQLTVLHL